MTKIGTHAFSYCTHLTSIEIPDSVTHIGDGAFYDCQRLTSIKISDNVTSIGEGAFSHCTSLASIKIPDGVTSIKEDAFYDCKSLTSIKIPNSVTSIGEAAFYDCPHLTSIEIPDSVTYIGDDAFSYCESLTNVVFEGKTLDEVESMNNYPWDIEDTSVIKAGKTLNESCSEKLALENCKTIDEQVREWAMSLSKLHEDDNREDMTDCPYLYVTMPNTSLNPPCRKAGKSDGERIRRKLERYSTSVPQNWEPYAVVFVDKRFQMPDEMESDFIDCISGNSQLTGKELIKKRTDDEINKGIDEFLNFYDGILGIAFNKEKMYTPE